MKKSVVHFAAICGMCLLLFAITISSCQKDNDSIFTQTNASNPDVIKGKLQFNSLNHLQSFYQELNKQIASTDEMNSDSLLDYLEYNLRFTSLRTYIKSHLIEERDSAEVDDFLLDDIRKTLLNEHYEIGIGDNTYIYWSENQIYNFPKNDSEKEMLFRAAEKGIETKIPFEMIDETVTLISKTKKIYAKKAQKGDLAEEECSLEINGIGFFELCNPSNFILSLDADLWHTDENDNGFFISNPNISNWEVDWGDGNIETVETSSDEIELTHTYEESGVYDLNFTVEYFDDWCNEGETSHSEEGEEPANVAIEPCNSYNISRTQWTEWGIFKMRAELWFKWDIFGTDQVAKTTSYKWHTPLFGSPHWKKDNAIVMSHLWYDFREGDCQGGYGNGIFSIIGVGDELDICGNCKSKRAAKSLSGEGNNLAIFDDLVHSYHYVNNQGFEMETELVLDICN